MTMGNRYPRRIAADVALAVVSLLSLYSCSERAHEQAEPSRSDVLLTGDVFHTLEAKRRLDARLDEAARIVALEYPPPWSVEAVAAALEAARDGWLAQAAGRGRGSVPEEDCVRCGALARVLGATETRRAAAVLGVTWDRLEGSNFGTFRTAVLEALFDNYVKDLHYGQDSRLRGGDLHGLRFEAVTRWWKANRAELER